MTDSPTQASQPKPKVKKVVTKAASGVDQGPKPQPSTARVRSTADKAKAWDATHKERLQQAHARGRAHGSGAKGFSSHVRSDAGADTQNKAEYAAAHKAGERSANYGKRSAKLAAKYGIKPKS